MTDNTKMHDPFAFREAARNHAMDEYFKARPQLIRTRHEERLFEAGFDRAWQAAQSVPVAGEPYLYVRSVHEGWPEYSKEDELSDGKGGGLALYLKPTHSISAAELERLKHCRELLKEARDDVAETLNCMVAAYRDSPRNKTRLDKQLEFLKQIDAAIAAEGEK